MQSGHLLVSMICFPCLSTCALPPAASPLENFCTDEWVVFERALVVRDIFTGGVRTFLSSADAKAFRALIYTQHGEVACQHSRLSSLVAPRVGRSASSLP